jgi:DNA polymerase III epsilon subunit-like protein
MILLKIYELAIRRFGMNYIVVDLEFNQDISSILDKETGRMKYPFEIIQIGAIKLDKDLNHSATFNEYVKPSIYGKINPFITDLTGITTEQLEFEKSYADVFDKFVDFIEEPDSALCTWGMSDMKELYKNSEYHGLDTNKLPRLYINLQPYITSYFNFPGKALLRLQNAVELLNIPIKYDFHNAANDAYYTAEVFKKTYSMSMKPEIYDPSYVKTRPRQLKKVIDVEGLLRQFEKMYSRQLTGEEKQMILLSYKMGKTGQFLKSAD